MTEQNSAGIFTDEDVEILKEAFETSDKRIVKELIYELGHDIMPVDYPSANPLTWPFNKYRSRRCWVTKIITKQDYHALIHHECIDDNTKISSAEAKTFLEAYTEHYGVGWKILSGWTKFWVTPAGETGIRLVKQVGNPLANIIKLKHILGD